ncbi:MULTISPECIES: flagellar hook capping FlgD N-terminal domain-containing protein [unclassified Luteibacter]|uniref:flagellar hook assembly protein FlgD n=1 Tax=unclassified Luteibacter TaxID=2620188 RepID=UPI0008CDCC30|nr:MULTISPECIES: flagellar hook capping FlgD N-terminal domain-containing protein [unclassified Luteibacter]MDR6936629.1 flagellar basal-body rod modification protein FlgD [Luteibacter sp. 3190]SEO67005.1 flagellar basal-body rod modification protein FlgD [Luteibacter sp. UNC138MFCol5.1]SEV83724.1 flagellar basal-body rod modification protein FlgD [Luteibacter sp. 329MFSha]
MAVDSIGSGSAAASSSSQLQQQTLSQSDFLKLIVTQMTNQDPTKPMDATQTVAQLAQFSQVAATQQLQQSFDSLASNLSGDQFVRAASLVGTEVLVPSKAAKLTDGTLGGAVNVGNSGTYVNVQIKDQAGNVVRTMSLGQPDAGLVKFTWDGKSDDGTQLADGVYQLSATSGGTAIDTFVRGKVEGVGASGTDGTYLQVAGYGGALLSQIAQIL